METTRGPARRQLSVRLAARRGGAPGLLPGCLLLRLQCGEQGARVASAVRPASWGCWTSFTQSLAECEGLGGGGGR